MKKLILALTGFAFLMAFTMEAPAEARLFKKAERKEMIKKYGSRNEFRAAKKQARSDCKGKGLKGHAKRECMRQTMRGTASMPKASPSSGAVPVAATPR
jgi:hypothetical protein